MKYTPTDDIAYYNICDICGHFYPCDCIDHECREGPDEGNLSEEDLNAKHGELGWTLYAFIPLRSNEHETL